MSKAYFLPGSDLEKLHWIQNFSTKLSTYATKYNISAAQVTDMQSGSAYFTYWLSYRSMYVDYLSKLTEYKNELIHGVAVGAMPSVQPVPPAIAAAPAVINSGIFKRATSIGNIIKSNSVYTIADGNDLGIEGAEDTTDVQTMKPVLKVHLIDGGKPEVKWTKKGMDGIEIYVDRGTGTFAFLVLDTYPDYTDTAALPAVGTSAVWSYKAIYHYADGQSGLWSDVVSITVRGN